MKKTPIIFKAGESADVDDSELSNRAKGLSSYIKELKDASESISYDSPLEFINLPDDSGVHEQVRLAFTAKSSRALKYIVVIGIGGSNLGAKAVYDALRGTIDGFTGEQPKMLFVDTISARLISHLMGVLDIQVKGVDELLLVAISKSGSTMETIVNFETLYNSLNEKYKGLSERVVVITDTDSELQKAGEEKGFHVLEIPASVVGRFSVMSAVGQLPLQVSGIHIDELLEGASDMTQMCLNESTEENPALHSALILYHHRQKNKRIHNIFVFNKELESLGKWYRQLIAESLGKKNDINEKEIREGILPLVSVGSSDLHSMAQLYFGGPQNIFTTFVYSKQLPTQVRTPKEMVLGGLVENIEDKSYKKVMASTYEGVKQAYLKNKMPFVEIELPEINAYTLGAFMQFKMMETLYLAKLLNVNCFDQPEVEHYKSETRKALL